MMKKIELEIETEYGVSHYGGNQSDEKDTQFEISDRLANYLRPLLEEGEDLTMDYLTEELMPELEDDNPDLFKELDKLTSKIEQVVSEMMMKHCIEEDSDDYDDDAIDEWLDKDIDEGRFVPDYDSPEAYFEAHRDDYDEESYEDAFDAEDDYNNWLNDAYIDWVLTLDDVDDQAERLFGEFNPLADGCYDYGYKILEIEE